MNESLLPNNTNNDSDRNDVSVEDILRSIDSFLENKDIDYVPSSFVLKILRLRITDPDSL